MNKQRGFTLVEIAIVLVIIGLLLGGVLKGQALITNAKVRNTVSRFDEMKAAVFGFQDRYKALPGDMSNANTVVGNGAARCTSNCDDGLIQPWRNTSLVTNNLLAAGLYSGNANTRQVNSPPTAKNAPTNAWGGATFVAYWNNYYNRGKAPSANGIYTGRSIPSTALAEIDRKLDDGKPQTGSFRSAWPQKSAATCVRGNNWVVTNGGADCAGVALY